MTECRIRSLFDQALAIPVSERAAWLGRSCGGDLPLQRAVAALLAAAEDDPERVHRVIDEAMADLGESQDAAGARYRALRRLLNKLSVVRAPTGPHRQSSALRIQARAKRTSS